MAIQKDWPELAKDRGHWKSIGPEDLSFAQ